ncbi:hypothetical protein CROQUDRAFT_99404 [Cronartium quercuum f. sp. fusiforme G11]|uniref:Uncharacterized protein n=1 Tax=Cronartium quercuum f. sp. fusiforme G11 TaxID=708437 RepID=A0A9P6NBF2_9BASI|nr:hypothetical protein CROQUDRAFT_99404 [Cronartium quercuum f. sp. fusiforme G11]
MSIVVAAVKLQRPAALRSQGLSPVSSPFRLSKCEWRLLRTHGNHATLLHASLRQKQRLRPRGKVRLRKILLSEGPD